MSFAGLAKIADYLDNKNKELPVGLIFEDSVFYKEFTKLFKAYTFHDVALPVSRSAQMDGLYKQPLKCLLSSNIEFFKKIGNSKIFNLSPNVLYVNQVPPHAKLLRSDIKPLMENAFSFNGLDGVIFTSEKLKSIYNSTNAKIYTMQLPIDEFWGGVRDASSRVVVNCDLPVKTGITDVHQLNIAINTLKGTILNNVIDNNIHWRNKIKEQFLRAKCLVNLSYCESDVYIYMLAASCGCPILSLPNVFIEEIFGDSAIFIDNALEISKYTTLDLTIKAKIQKEAIRNIYCKKELVDNWNELFNKISAEVIC
jgi:hypothetical protein